MKYKIFIQTAIIIQLILISNLLPASISQSNYAYNTLPGSVSIMNINGKLYAYIVLLFNENPHFVNLIQKDTIPLKTMANEGFNIKEYKIYLNTINDENLKRIARTILTIYLDPDRFNQDNLKLIEKKLEKRNIILNFSVDKNASIGKIMLNYCIYGKKRKIKIKHPLMESVKEIYNIQPFIYYDEFSTSNSTFYYNMIYINSIEVQNDYLIALKVTKNISVDSMFFVGSVVTDDIRYCLKKAFSSSKSIKPEIWKLFVIHELTHKILDNKYNNFDQVTGEELSLCSTIYSTPYLGLSVMYSYLNYNVINPHRIAAKNFIRFIAEKKSNMKINDKPGLIKYFTISDLKSLAKAHFKNKIKEIE